MRRAFTLLEIVVLLTVVLILASILWTVLARARGNAQRVSCQNNLKQIGLGFMQYVRDYDELFPPARLTKVTGWADVLQPWVKSTQIFHCPSAQVTASRFASDYFYNRRFARLSLSSVHKPELILFGGDGPEGATTWSSWTGLPRDAAANQSSPAQRHMGNANYLFGDGHVKALKPSEIGRLPPKLSFSIK